MKIYLCGVTHNQKENIDALTKNIYEHIDGLIYVDAGSTDGTKELIRERLGHGQIIHREWTNDHDFQMNEFLRRGPMKNGDWFILRDSMERFNPDFAKNIRSFINQIQQGKIFSVYSHNKGFAFQYFDDMFFLGNPHWGLQNARGQAIDLKGYYKEERDYAYRIKDGEDGGRPLHNFIDHFVRYYFVYPRSNHLLLGREDRRGEFVKKEQQRQIFRHILGQMNIEYSLNALKRWMEAGDFKKDEFLLGVVNDEKILSDFYRWHILSHSLEELNSPYKICSKSIIQAST